MNDSRRDAIVAGVDGSPESLVAARWAAREAEVRRLPLLMVLAINEPVAGHSDFVFPPSLIEAIRSINEQRLAGVAAAIREEFPDLTVQTALERMDPRQALVAGSRHSALTVVGTRGRGQLPEVLVGSVALYVAAHAHSPVAVVPPSADVTTGAVGPILVGVDGRPNSVAAIAYAFEEADIQKTTLTAALVFDDLDYRGFAKGGNLIGRLEDDEEHAVLAEQLSGWREKYPDTLVRPFVLRGRPAEGLLGYAKNGPPVDRPRLIVVGTRGRGGLAGLLLGSTSQRLITHAEVPVIVVPQDVGHP